MNDMNIERPIETTTQAATAESTERLRKVENYVRTNPAYYAHQFEKIGGDSYVQNLLQFGLTMMPSVLSGMDGA